ncbi:VanZ family protein [Candidatus Bipolaricaulota bacterium]|nr:VanZ family protein [Candidatus Bipolaricaulota bacterium]
MRRVRWTFVLAWMGFLAYLSLGRAYPPPIEGALRITGTTVLHFAGYGILAAALAWALGGRARSRLAAPALAFAYGAVLEALQLAVPGRTADWADLGINLAGALTGTLIVLLAIRLSHRARPNRGETPT